MLERLPGLSAVSAIRHAETERDNGGQAEPGAARRPQILHAPGHRRGADGEAAGVVSAGNTGALMAMAKVVLRTLPGIDRPAIAAFFPTLRGESVMLDLGANVECDADNLVQFAVMGERLRARRARRARADRRPAQCRHRGDEGPRGSARGAAPILRAATHLPGTSTASSKATTSRAGTVDVVVTDGFTGNVALKSIEGTAKLYGRFPAPDASRARWLARIGYLMARPALNALRARLDPRRYNGAIFLGLNGIVREEPRRHRRVGFANAIGVAVDMVQNGAIAKMQQEFER